MESREITVVVILLIESNPVQHHWDGFIPIIFTVDFHSDRILHRHALNPNPTNSENTTFRDHTIWTERQTQSKRTSSYRISMAIVHRFLVIGAPDWLRDWSTAPAIIRGSVWMRSSFCWPNPKWKALSHILDVVFSKTFFGGICREKKFSKIQHLRCETGPLTVRSWSVHHDRTSLML